MNLIKLNFEVVHAMCVVNLVHYNHAVEYKMLVSPELRGCMLNAWIVFLGIIFVDLVVDKSLVMLGKFW